MKNNIFTVGFCAVISIALIFIYLLGYKHGRKIGHAIGMADSAIQFTASIENYDAEIAELKERISDSYALGFKYGKQEAEEECDDHLKVSNSICIKDLEEAFALGKKAGMKKVK